MTLREFLKSESMTLAEFGRRSGVGNKVTVHRLVHGKRFPGPQEMQAIREATGGKVTPDDFVAQHVAAAPAPARQVAA